MKQASNVGDTRKLYQIIRQFSGKLSALCESFLDVNGGFIADNSAKVDRWREHFDPEIQSPLGYAVSCDLSSEDEVADAMQRLRNNKASGEDDILAEIYKSCVDTLAPWTSVEIRNRSRCLGSGILVPVYKKGNKTRCENYCGISLIDVAVRIFAIVLLRRFQSVRDSRTQPNHAGYRTGRILGKSLREEDGVELAPGHWLTDLDYAEDIALLTSSFRDLQYLVSRVNNTAASVGLSINTERTKLLASCLPDQGKAPSGINCRHIEQLKSFKYIWVKSSQLKFMANNGFQQLFIRPNICKGN
ncbi:unnamed protein product [Dibothriocephalus latus]|uniref:Reverse transcriptase domain-containing protein n=1 Tax=Dibothriocephalus latus TaxID=60516 RepID=A0A3P7M4I9_DIBLA|nr:unnamed protein product [Dibothriocephalus latus]